MPLGHLGDPPDCLSPRRVTGHNLLLPIRGAVGARCPVAGLWCAVLLWMTCYRSGARKEYFAEPPIFSKFSLSVFFFSLQGEK